MSKDDYLYRIDFRFPPKLIPFVHAGDLAREDGQVVRIEQAHRDVSVLSVGRFATQELAEAALRLPGSALALLGAVIGCGVDEVKTFAGPASKLMPGTLTVLVEPDDKVDVVQALDLLSTIRDVSPKYRTAARLFDESFFADDLAASLVLCTTGLELLSQPRQPAAKDVLDAIDRVVKVIRAQTDVDPPIQKKLVRAVQNQKSESIREAVRREVGAVVPEVSMGKVDEIYAIRSSAVHSASEASPRLFAASQNAQVLLRYMVLRGTGFKTSDAILG